MTRTGSSFLRYVVLLWAVLLALAIPSLAAEVALVGALPVTGPKLVEEAEIVRIVPARGANWKTDDAVACGTAGGRRVGRRAVRRNLGASAEVSYRLRSE